MRNFKRLVLAAVLALSVPVAGRADSGKSSTFANALVSAFFRGATLTLPTSFDIRLGSACTASSFTELTTASYPGYAMITCTASYPGTACNPSTSNWALASSGLTSNSNAVNFAATTGVWTGVQCGAITDTSGNVWYWGNLSGAPVSVPSGSMPTFPAATIVVGEQ